MTTRWSDNLEPEFKKLLETLAPAITVLMAIHLMLGVKLFGARWNVERELGRKLTEEVRIFYQEECQRRISAEWSQKSSSEHYAGQEPVRTIIRCVVWEENL